MTENGLEILNARLAKGEITTQEYDAVRTRLMGEKPAPPRIALITISTVAILLLGAQASMTHTEPPDLTTGQAFGVGVVLCVVWPLVVIWLRALWNTIVPPMTGWPRINFWHAAGILVLGILLHL